MGVGVGVQTMTQPVRVKVPPKKKVGILDKDYIFFDNAATGKLSEYAKELIRECLDKDWCWANGSSIYRIGREAKNKLEESRQIIASCINVKPSEIYFTSGSSESISWIIKGVLAHPDCNGKTLLTSLVEHPAVWACAKSLKIKVDYIDVDENSCVQPDRFYQYLTERTVDRNLYGLVEILHVGNELGNVNDIATLAKISQNYNIPFFSDCTQSVGKIPIDVKDLSVDYICASAHKWGALKQSGFVYISDKAKIKPLPLIRGAQEKSKRGGTESILNAWVMAKTLQAKMETLKEDMERVERLKHRLVYELNSLQEATGLRIELNGNPLSSENYGIGIVNFCIPDMKQTGESIVLLMSAPLPGYETSICISAGSACSSGSNSPSRVLMALHDMTREKAVRSVRVSFSADNTIGEIEYLIAKLKFVLENLN